MSLRTPPLRDVHAAAGAKFTDFGGWEMPVEFSSIREEHEAVRSGVGVFDVSHMGEIEVRGPDAGTLMNRLTSRDPTALSPGRAQYAMIVDEDGILLDDTMTYRLPEDGDADYLFVPNAGHDEEMAERWTRHRDEWGLDATVENRTEAYALFAVQGPDAVDALADAADEDVSDVGMFNAAYRSVAGVRSLVSRTGYTGEDGFEVLCPTEDAETVWNALDCRPCGLGARDTLRTEMGFLLSGQDFDPEENPRTPFEARAGPYVDLDSEFVGRDALAEQAAAGVAETLVGFELSERGVPRHGYDVESYGGDAVGTVTSGTMSPTLDDPIGLAYVPTEYAVEGMELGVSIRGESKSATVVTPPFLRGY